MSQYHYVVTAQKPGVVTHTVTGHFTSPTDRNLIIAKSTRLEVHVMASDGLQLISDIPIYGRIASLELFRPKGATRDRLFVATERYKFCVLEYDATTREIVTLAAGDVKHKIGRPVENGAITVIDSKCRFIGLHLYDGIFQVIILGADGTLATEPIDMRLEELEVIRLCLLEGQSKPTLLVLHQDSHEKRHLRTYTINIKDKTLDVGPWPSLPNVELGASFLIPVPAPLAGALLIGDETVTYVNNKVTKQARMVPTQITAWAKIDACRYLIGDLSGNLSVVVLKTDNVNNLVTSLAVEPVGVTSSAHAMTYLDNGHVFIGSVFGDSQLIKLNSEADEHKSFVSIIESYPNLGAIVDMAVVDLDRQGQAQVVTCSGAYKDGSLRIIRNGIGINEEASVPMPGIKGVWSLRDSYDAIHDRYLVESFVGETRILAIDDEQLDEVELKGFDNAQTLFCTNVINDLIVQVTSTHARLVSHDGHTTISTWSPADGKSITVAHANATQLVVATSGCGIVLLSMETKELKQVTTATLDHEISCIDVSPIINDKPLSSPFVAIGMWKDISVRVLALSSLTELNRASLGGEVVPRSVMFARFNTACYLFCGLGDGHLFNFEFEPTTFALSNRKKIALGTQPITLSQFRGKDQINIFAACDRPTVISTASSRDNKPIYSNVNLKDVNFMTPFNAKVFPKCLAFATEESLIIGPMDSLQRLHVRSIPLGEQPRRITYIRSGHVYCVATIKYDGSDDTNGGEMHMIRLYDDTTYECIHSVQLDAWENVASMITTKFAGDTHDYIIVGTAVALPDEPEPSRGYIAVFRVGDRKLIPVARQPTKGAVYTLAAFQGRLLAGINSKVQLYRWQTTGLTPATAAAAATDVPSLSSSTSSSDSKEAKRDTSDSKTPKKSSSTGSAAVAAISSSATPQFRLVPECSHHGHIIVLCIRARGDFIVVADLQKSVTLLSYRPATNTIEELSRDYDPNWMTAVDILGDDIYLGAENQFNLFTLARPRDVTAEEDRARLERVGGWHLGDFVNTFQTGSLVMHLPDGDTKEASDRIVPTHLFGTINGVIGVIAPLTKVQYQWLAKLEEKLEEQIKGVGGFLHKEWRQWYTDRRIDAKSGFVDGDLIEQYLDLPPVKQEQIATAMEMTPADIWKRVEELSRIH